jgi:hypothetical protein
MADIEEQAVMSEVEDAMQGDKEFDDAEIWREVSTGLLYLGADRMPHLLGQHGELIEIEGFEIGWR